MTELPQNQSQATLPMGENGRYQSFEWVPCTRCAGSAGTSCPDCAGNFVAQATQQSHATLEPPFSRNRARLPEKARKSSEGVASALEDPRKKSSRVSEKIMIRDMLPVDETDWRALWGGYNDFYDACVAPKVTSHTWQRILDPASPLMGRLALFGNTPVGFSHCVLHEGTWVDTPLCYLEDLFVDPSCRGLGIGRQLIRDLVDLGQAQGWSGLYWHTRDSNPARHLYDEFVKADDFVRYRMKLSRD